MFGAKKNPLLAHFIGSDVAPIGMVFKYITSSCSKSSEATIYGILTKKREYACLTKRFNRPIFWIPVSQDICIPDGQLDRLKVGQRTSL